MADQKKMSVAEILAAARKMDSAGGSEPSKPAEAAAATPSTTSPEPHDVPPSAPAEKAASKPASKPAGKPSAGGGRPSIAEMLALARAEKQEGGAAKKVPAIPAEKPAAEKPAAKAAPKPPAKAPASGPKEPAAGPLDTASILAAARKADKPGPMSKAEAARLKTVDGKAAPAAPAAKKKIEAPPMPVKPVYAQRPAPAPRPTSAAAPAESDRRGFLLAGWIGLGAVGALWTLATLRFMYPNVLREPPSQFKVGFPGDFAPGTVEEKFKAQFGIWVVNTEYNGQQQLFALKSVCTHLGCTPNWLEAEQKFKCPCHGSGFYKDGINFEGPAPRPLERYAIRVADDGQVEIDKSRTFQEEMGAWADSGSFIPV